MQTWTFILPKYRAFYLSVTDSLLAYQADHSGLRRKPRQHSTALTQRTEEHLCVSLLHAACWLSWLQHITMGFSGCDKMLTKSNSGRKEFIWLALPHHCALSRGARAGRSSKKKLKKRPWRSVDFYLASHGVLSLLSYTTRTACPTAMARGQSDGVNF